jgi:Ca2+-binding RTX toxin-like protein
MRGGLGDDTYHVDHIGDRTDETIGGGGTLDTVVSSVSFTAAAGIERLFLSGAGAIDATGRNGQAEILIGNAGANRLDGRGGNDTLTGGLGADRFTFSSALNAATNIDRITDFVSGTDKIGLSATVFAAVNAVGAGLQAGEFRLGPAAADANDHIVYNRATGQLFYDANGAAAGGQIFFARLAPGAALAATDFVMA